MKRYNVPNTYEQGYERPPRLMRERRDWTPLYFGLFVLAMLCIIVLAMGWV